MCLLLLSNHQVASKCRLLESRKYVSLSSQHFALECSLLEPSGHVASMCQPSALPEDLASIFVSTYQSLESSCNVISTFHLLRSIQHATSMHFYLEWCQDGNASMLCSILELSLNIFFAYWILESSQCNTSMCRYADKCQEPAFSGCYLESSQILAYIYRLLVIWSGHASLLWSVAYVAVSSFRLFVTSQVVNFMRYFMTLSSLVVASMCWLLATSRHVVATYITSACCSVGLHHVQAIMMCHLVGLGQFCPSICRMLTTIPDFASSLWSLEPSPGLPFTRCSVMSRSSLIAAYMMMCGMVATGYSVEPMGGMLTTGADLVHGTDFDSTCRLLQDNIASMLCWVLGSSSYLLFQYWIMDLSQCPTTASNYLESNLVSASTYWFEFTSAFHAFLLFQFLTTSHVFTQMWWYVVESRSVPVYECLLLMLIQDLISTCWFVMEYH